MKVEFISNLNRQYMSVVTNDSSDPKEGYVQKMILENEIEGVLAASRAGIDGKEILCYDITGKVSVCSYLSARAADEEFFTKLLNGIADLQKTLQRFLISRAFMMALPEQIFFDPGNGCFWFGIWPEENRAYARHMQKLSEFLISGLATGDRNAAQTVYGFYQACISGDISETEIKKITGTHNRVPEYESDLLTEGTVQTGSAWETTEPVSYEKKKRNGKRKPTVDENRFPVRFKGKIRTLKEWLLTDRSVLKQRKQKKEDGKNEEYLRMLIRHQPSDPARAEDEAPGTVFLQERGPASECGFELVPKNGRGKRIPLIKEINTVGRSGKMCDIVIADGTVSRVHAKLIWNGDSFDVIDVGSRNGTKVNGRVIPKEVPFHLSDTDTVSFAGAEFFLKAALPLWQNGTTRY